MTARGRGCDPPPAAGYSQRDPCMHVTTGTFATPNGARYIRQMCKHFAHELETEVEKNEGYLRFDMGTAYLSADAGALTVRFELHNADAFEGAQHVIDDHLKRFAFREGFEHMEWDWAPPPTVRSAKRAAADLLRQRLPGLHAALRNARARLR